MRQRGIRFGLAAVTPARLLLATLCTTLVSCAHYQPRPLELDRNRQDWAARRLDPATLQRFAPEVAGQWGRAELLALALAQNPAVRQARAAVERTRAAALTAREVTNPAVTLGAEYDLARAAEPPWLWSIATSFLVDAISGRPARMALATTTTRAAQADLREAIWALRRDLRSAGLAYHSAGARTDIVEAEVGVQEHLLRLAEARVAEGESAAAEARQLALDLARSRAALADLRARRLDEGARMAALVGVPPEALIGATTAFERYEDLPPSAALQAGALDEKALASRGDLERAIAEYDASERVLKRALGAQRFQLAVGPGYTYDHGLRRATLGVSFNLPILNQHRGPIAEARAAREEAGRRAERVQQSALDEIAVARLGYDQALEALADARRRRAAAEAVYRDSDRRMLAGDIDRPALLSAELLVLAERLAVVDAVDQAQRALGTLEDALRTPLTGPELRLQAGLRGTGQEGASP